MGKKKCVSRRYTHSIHIYIYIYISCMIDLPTCGGFFNGKCRYGIFEKGIDGKNDEFKPNGKP